LHHDHSLLGGARYVHSSIAEKDTISNDNAGLSCRGASLASNVAFRSSQVKNIDREGSL
jgi:hypothetical protein